MEQVARAHSIIRVPPAQVFEAFVNPELMKQFWFHRADQGLKANESVTFYLGNEDGAFGFKAHVIALKPHSLIHIQWGDDNGWTDVQWLLEETADGDTRLTIEESGFSGSDAEIIARALDSTGGFNQVIIAAKALLEHGVAVNVVTDRA